MGQLATGGLQPARPSMHIDEASVNEINASKKRIGSIMSAIGNLIHHLTVRQANMADFII